MNCNFVYFNSYYNYFGFDFYGFIALVNDVIKVLKIDLQCALNPTSK